MMRRASMAANAAAPPVSVELPAALSATVERVVGWGGDPLRYAAAAAAGFAALESIDGAAEASAMRAIGAVAAWRSGIPAFRRAARDAASELPRDAAAAVLGLTGDQVHELLASADDPLTWPGSGAELALVGGFRGLGGAWTERPDEVVVGAGATLSVRTGEQWWRVELDAVGCRVTPSDGPAPAVAPELARITAAISADSYLVTVWRVR